MTPEENVKYCLKSINNHRTTIEHAVLSHFGIKTNLAATLHNLEKHYNYYITVEDTLKSDIDKKMRGNKLLRSLFSSVYLYGDVWYTEEDNTITIRFLVKYNHTSGGSNGIEIGVMSLNLSTGTVKWMEYKNYNND